MGKMDGGYGPQVAYIQIPERMGFPMGMARGDPIRTES
jgi:hypothetical protein